MDRYPNSPRDDIFTLARRVTPAHDREYIRDLEEGIKTVGRVLDSYKHENRRLRTEVDDLRERTCGRLALFERENIAEKTGEEGSRGWDTRGRRLVMDKEQGRSSGTERRSASSRSNIGIKRDTGGIAFPRYEACENVRPIRDLDLPTAGLGAPMGHFNHLRDCEPPRQYDRTRDYADNATDVRDYAYSQQLRPEPAPEHRTSPVPNDEEAKWHTYKTRLPARDWELPVAEYDTRTYDKIDQQNHNPAHLYDQDRDDQDIKSRIRGHACEQDLSPEPYVQSKPRSISSDEKTIWQGHFSPSSSQTTERLRSTSSVWERRETLDGLYWYYLNTEDGRMTDPQPIPRDESEGEKFDLRKLRVTPCSPPVSRKAAPDTTQKKDVSPALPVQVPYRYQKIAAPRDVVKEIVQVLGSTSTNGSKPSRSTAENLPPSPRSYYRNSTPAQHGPRKSVVKPSMNTQPVLPRPPIGVYNNREYAQQYSSKKVSPLYRLPEPKPTLKPSIPLASNAASTDISKISKTFTPSPRSHHGYGQGTTKTSAHLNQHAQITPSQQTPIKPSQQTSTESFDPSKSQPSTSPPQAMHGVHLSTFTEAYGGSQGNYQVPFVNTVTDIDEGERRNRSVAKVQEIQYTKKESKQDEVELIVPIRPRPITRASGHGLEANEGGQREVATERGREYRAGGKVRWTGSS
ncbi:hypothetical protein EG328_009407 [Venturia inaequalis]|uniref:Uncharacterized protein n=1 Tax=Venturia inaequalis TaxID=5025 RepID=A0A8H3YPR2_VENIN|nr:hypothetical protein EG328_009407 [Venturia inaequalis]